MGNLKYYLTVMVIAVIGVIVAKRLPVVKDYL